MTIPATIPATDDLCTWCNESADTALAVDLFVPEPYKGIIRIHWCCLRAYAIQEAGQALWDAGPSHDLSRGDPTALAQAWATLALAIAPDCSGRRD